MHATCVAETLPLQCSACSSVVHICSERRPLVYSLCAAMSDHVRTVDTTCQTQLALCFLSCHAIFHNLGCIVVALLPEVFLYSHTSRCIFVICVLAFFSTARSASADMLLLEAFLSQHNQPRAVCHSTASRLTDFAFAQFQTWRDHIG